MAGILPVILAYVKYDYFYLYGAGPHISMDVTYRDFRITPIPKDCNSLVVNPSIEDGTAAAWYLSNPLASTKIVSPGADGSQYAVRFHTDHVNWNTNQWNYYFLQELDAGCFATDQEFVISAQFRLLDNTDLSKGMDCDPEQTNVWSPGHCPTIRLYGHLCDGGNEDLMFKNEMVEFQWNKDGFNAFQANFTVTENWASCQKTHIHMGRFNEGHHAPEGRDLVMDNIQFVRRT